MMLACWASRPFDCDAPSRKIKTGVPAKLEDNQHFSLFCFGTLENGFKYKVYWCILVSTLASAKNVKNLSIHSCLRSELCSGNTAR
jgi:hypothetical protein